PRARARRRNTAAAPHWRITGRRHVGMFIDLTDEQRALQAELREYFSALMTPERRDSIGGESMGGAYRQVIKQMGTDGWLGIGWPTEFGGQGRGPTDQLIFLEEAARGGAPIPLVTLNTVGPTIAVYGSDAQKEKFLPAILAGEIHFAIGYTEPEAG